MCVNWGFICVFFKLLFYAKVKRITTFALKGLLVFMNWCNFQQSTHHNFCIWKFSFLHELMLCIFKQPFSAKQESQKVHLKDFSYSWTDGICTFKLSFCAKLESQRLHLKGFFFSWTDAIYWLISPFLTKLASLMLHLKGFFFSWTDTMCTFKLPSSVKLASQVLHLKDFSFHELMHYVFLIVF